MPVSSMKYSRDVYTRTIIDAANVMGDGGAAFVPGDDGKCARHSTLTSDFSGVQFCGSRTRFMANRSRSRVQSGGLGLITFFFFPNIVNYDDGKQLRSAKIK